MTKSSLLKGPQTRNINKYGQYIVVALLIIVALFLLASKLIVWGLAAFGAGMLVLGIQQLIKLNVRVSLFEDNIKDLDEKNRELRIKNNLLVEENNFLKERQFQITQIRHILELNLFEIETHFTRSLSRQETIADRKIKYFGSLNVKLNAKYGIDCKDLRFRYDNENRSLTVANINPKFLSFGSRSLEWDFFEIFEYRSQNPFAENRWMTSDDLNIYANKVKEDYRIRTEQSLEKGPEDIIWIYKPLKENVRNIIKVLFGGIFSDIKFTDTADETFIDFESLSRITFTRPPGVLKATSGE
ncbi:MAG: hypothetical protein JXR66_01105 [Bacteroidales bacterium]|nr:hypothetical protein [Bacteroidales bacterium]